MIFERQTGTDTQDLHKSQREKNMQVIYQSNRKTPCGFGVREISSYLQLLRIVLSTVIFCFCQPPKKTGTGQQMVSSHPVPKLSPESLPGIAVFFSHHDWQISAKLGEDPVHGKHGLRNTAILLPQVSFVVFNCKTHQQKIISLRFQCTKLYIPNLY